MNLRIPKTIDVPFTFNFMVRDEDGELVQKSETTWIDIYDHLFMKRTIFLSGLIDNKTATRIVALMLFLSRNNKKILLFINSPGGEARSAITIYDNMKAMRPEIDIYTIVTGLAASSASLVLSGGSTRCRIAFPNARISIEQPVAGHFSGPPDLLVLEAKEMLELRNTIADIYSKNTDKPVSVLQQDMEEGLYMSAEEARDYGIIDGIAKYNKKKILEEGWKEKLIVKLDQEVEEAKKRKLKALLPEWMQEMIKNRETVPLPEWAEDLIKIAESSTLDVDDIEEKYKGGLF